MVGLAAAEASSRFFDTRYWRASKRSPLMPFSPTHVVFASASASASSSSSREVGRAASVFAQASRMSCCSGALSCVQVISCLLVWRLAVSGLWAWRAHRRVERGLGEKLEMRQTVGRRAARGRVLRRGWGRGESHNAAGIGRCCERRSRETPDPKSQTITRQQRARLSLAHFTTHTHLLSGRDRSGGKKAHVGCIHPHKVNIRERCTLCTGMDVPSGSRSKYPPVGAGAWFARSKNGTMTRMTPPPPFSRAVYF